MQIGDLVRIINEWTSHNPWMILPEDKIKIGLVVGSEEDWDGEYVKVLSEGETLTLHPRRLEVLCK